MDVNSLLTNFPHDGGIAAARNFLDQFPSPNAPSETIIKPFYWTQLHTTKTLSLSAIRLMYKQRERLWVQKSPPATQTLSSVFSKKHLSTLITSND